MIPAQRFKFLDQETNVSVQDFINIDSSDIFNAISPGLFKVTSELSALLNKMGFPDIQKELGNLTNNALGSVTQYARNALNGITDAIGLSKDAIDSFGRDLFGGIEGGLSTFKSLTDTVQQTILIGSTLYNEANTFITQGSQILQGLGGDTQSLYGLTDLVGKITNGQLNDLFTDQYSLERMLSGVSYGCFGSGLSGQFEALANKVNDAGVITRSIVTLSSRMAEEGNINALLELTDYVHAASGNRRLANDVYQYIPNIPSQVLSGYKIPRGVNELGLSNCYGSLNTALDTLALDWDKSESNTFSMRSMTTNNNDLRKVTQASVYRHTPGVPDNNYAVPTLDEDQLRLGVLALRS